MAGQKDGQWACASIGKQAVDSAFIHCAASWIISQHVWNQVELRAYASGVGHVIDHAKASSLRMLNGRVVYGMGLCKYNCNAVWNWPSNPLQQNLLQILVTLVLG